MKLLLDTHTFIWWDTNPQQLSPHALALCRNPENQLILSVVSIWEMVIKIQIGKLQFARPLAEMIADQQKTNRMILLSVDPAHVFAVASLPLHHKDPFDRLLIAQASVEGIALLSRDTQFSNYKIQVEWEETPSSDEPLTTEE